MIYSAIRPFTKNKKEFKNLRKQEIQDIFIKKELDKACFKPDMVPEDFKVLPRRKASDKVLRDEAFNIAKTPNYYTPKRGLASIVHKFFNIFF